MHHQKKGISTSLQKNPIFHPSSFILNFSTFEAQQAKKVIFNSSTFEAQRAKKVIFNSTTFEAQRAK
jgi:hypothetical protein